MTRKFKTIQALFLSVVVIISLVGCGQGISSDAGSTSTAVASSESSAVEPTVTAPVKATINILTESNQGITVPGVQDDQVAMQIEKDTGITMNIENIEGSLIIPKISAMMASGDLPDLFVFDDDKSTRATLIESGSVLDITDLAQTKLTNWMKNEKLKFNLEFSKKYLSNGTGKLYNIPMNNGVNSSPSELTVGANIRWDYYKELGYPEVKDIMDVLPVLNDMVAKHPKTSDGKPAYGLAFWSDWAIWPVAVFGFIDGYAEANNFGTIDISNEKFVSILDDTSVFWKYTKFYNKAQQLGILDPDSYTMKETDFEAKVAAGQEYFFINGWLSKNWKGNPDQGYSLIDTTGNSDKSYPIWGADVGVSYAISKNSKVADRVLDLFNYLATDDAIRMLTNGVQGQTWDLVNGKPQFKEGIIDIVSDSNNAEAAKYGYKKYAKLSPIAAGVKDSNGNFYDFRFEPDYAAKGLTEVEKDSAKFYNKTLPSSIYTEKKFVQYGNVLMSAMPEISDKSYKQKSSNMDKYITDNWIKLVNAKDDAAYVAEKAKFTKDLKDMGWDEMLTKFMEVYNKTKADLDAIK